MIGNETSRANARFFSAKQFIVEKLFSKIFAETKNACIFANTKHNNMNAQDLKKGSIVKMTFITHSNEINPNWEIRWTQPIGEGDDQRNMTCYIAECIVHRVTPKFFTVIIPHLNAQSVRYSKECFTTTKQSYADDADFKASIVKI